MLATIDLIILAAFAFQGGPTAPPGRTLQLTATAYCQSGETQSGAKTRTGIVAADPTVLPVGSVLRIDAPRVTLDGIYTVMDTGSKIKGRRIDIYMPDCTQARAFGEQSVKVRVLRRGWNPKASAPPSAS
jgi:3D (Asp-Asp-Asp) domain-containing protein